MTAALVLPLTMLGIILLEAGGRDTNPLFRMPADFGARGRRDP
ncbi:MAG: hypothetical protein WKH97_01785 [Casimicrobiaceae bacterium]